MSNFNNKKLENNVSNELLPYSKINNLENKYLKYKQKYLNLKNEKLTINKSLSVSYNEYFYESLIDTFKSNILQKLNIMTGGVGAPIGNRLYYIEGNIGSGKTTLTEKLNDYDNVEIILEAVDVWKTPVYDIYEKKNTNVLAAFYTEPKRNAFLFQVVALYTTAIRHMTPQEKQIRFCERSIDSVYNIFINNLKRDKLLNPLELYWIDRFYEWLRRMVPKPDGIIYVRCDPQVSFNRVNKRGRPEEKGIPLELLQSIHDRHEEWIVRLDKGHLEVLTIDNNTDDNFEEVIREVFYFIGYDTIPNKKNLSYKSYRDILTARGARSARSAQVLPGSTRKWN